MNKIFNELKKGEPFYFIREGNVLKIGVVTGYDKNHKEHFVWECAIIKSEGRLIKKKPSSFDKVKSK